MSQMNNWNNTKLVVHQHHNDLYNLTTPKALQDDPGDFTLVRTTPTLKQSVQLVIVALFLAILRR